MSCLPKANSGTFSYPGGKTTIAPWIVDHFPDHDIYVEPFGGSASTFMYKPKSPTEVYNDLNEHCVTFFQVIKDRPDDLRDWIRATPYSRKLFDEWVEAFKDGRIPEDSVEHAGRFWFIQTASFGGKLATDGGSFSVDKKPPGGTSSVDGWRLNTKRLEAIRDRFRHVQIEYQDYRKVVKRYDTPDTLFYFDPPYVGVGDDYYQGEGFDHAEFGDVCDGIAGYWIVSYDDLPEWCDDYHIVSRSREWTLDADRESEGTERLVMNYNPDTTPKFVEEGQATVDDFGGSDD